MTDSIGSFSIKDIPPGTYDVVAWHTYIPQKKAVVTIKSSGMTQIDFEFNGKDKLLQQVENGEHKYIKRFVIDERIVARHGDKVTSGNVNGVVTSGNYSPMLGKSIGFALFESKPESDSIKLSIRDRLVDGKVIQGRFIGK